MKIDFIKYFDLSHLSETQQTQMVGALTDLVLARFADMIGDHLTEEEITQLEAVSRAGDSEAVIDWLNQNIPNATQGINEILEEERESIALKIDTLVAELGKDSQDD